MKNNILDFGKFKGKKFQYVVKKHKDYCQWILDNLDYNSADQKRKDFYDFLLFEIKNYKISFCT